jgi:hypothetical protein
MQRIVFILLLLIPAGLYSPAQNIPPKPVVSKPVYFDISLPLRDLQRIPPAKTDQTWKDGIVKNKFYIRRKKNHAYPFVTDPSIRPYNGTTTTDTTSQTNDPSGSWYRLRYRMFNGYQSMVCNHTVNVWMQIRYG